MEVDASCKDVGAGQTLERQLCTVRTTTDGLHLGSYAALLHGFQHEVDDVHLRVYLLLHVVVLVADNTCYGALSVTFVHLLGTVQNKALAVFKTVAVVVADDVAEASLFHTGGNAQQMIETLIALSRLWCLVGRQHGGKLHGQTVGIDHLVFGIARVYADALDGNLR